MICVVIGYSLGRKSHSWQNLSLFGRCYLTSHVKTRSSFLKASFGFIFKMCTQIWFCINNVNYSLNLQIICAILWYVLLSGREISVISHSPIVFQSRGLSVSPWSGFLTVFVTQTMCTHCSHKCHLKNEIITCSTIRQASPRDTGLWIIWQDVSEQQRHAVWDVIRLETHDAGLEIYTCSTVHQNNLP